jgi:hypothetical protein
MPILKSLTEMWGFFFTPMPLADPEFPFHKLGKPDCYTLTKILPLSSHNAGNHQK